MTDQASALETNDTSLSLDDILNPKKVEDKKEPEVVEKTKAEDNQPEAGKEEDKASEQPKTDEALEKLKKRLEDTQKWGNSQRQATLQIIKNLKEKGLSDEDIADTIGGKEVFDKVLKGLPIEQELSNPVAVVTQAFNSQINAVEAAFKELGHTDEQLKEFMEAFNTLAYDEPEHRDEMYRRATSGEDNVAAYALKVGKEKLEEYRVSKQIKTKGVKSFTEELREQIKQELMAEMKSVKDEVAEELGKSKGKPRLVGGSTPTTESKPNDHKSLKDILGM
jgi:hypothetical protein